MAFDNGIGFPIGLLVLSDNHVGSKHRKLTLLHPTVVNGMARLHIMVAHRACIILHIVEHSGTKVR